jgi:hypothetical protein
VQSKRVKPVGVVRRAEHPRHETEENPAQEFFFFFCAILGEPPDADPHVRWCERGRLAAAPYSISLIFACPGALRAKEGRILGMSVLSHAHTQNTGLTTEIPKEPFLRLFVSLLATLRGGFSYSGSIEKWSGKPSKPAAKWALLMRAWASVLGRVWT